MQHVGFTDKCFGLQHLPPRPNGSYLEGKNPTTYPRDAEEAACLDERPDI